MFTLGICKQSMRSHSINLIVSAGSTTVLLSFIQNTWASGNTESVPGYQCGLKFSKKISFLWFRELNLKFPQATMHIHVQCRKWKCNYNNKVAFIVNIANKLAKRIPKSIFSLITSWILRIIRVQLRVQKLLNLKYSVGPELIKFHANIILSRMTKVRLIERGLANIHRIAKLMVTPKAYSSIISNLKWYFPYLFDLL